VIEQGKDLPAQTDSVFIEQTKVPYAGFIQISLTAKRSGATTREFWAESREIPAVRWYSHFGRAYNKGQAALRHIPWVGKPLEEIAADAYQNVKLQYKMSVTTEKRLICEMRLIRTRDNKPLLTFRPEFLL